MKKWIIGLVVLVLILAPVACAKAPSSSPVPAPTPAPAPAPRPAPAPAPSITIPPSSPSQGGSYGEVVPSTSTDRMVIRNGELSLIVKDVAAARDAIGQLAQKFDGYVVSSYISGGEDRIRGQVAIRVPDEQFEPALAELNRLAVRVNTERTTGQDVTEEYTDLQARLKNAQAVEAQYLALLDKAKNVDEILKIYDSLSQVRQQIEQLKGRIQFLERSASMSLITVNLQPETSAKPLANPGWNPLEVFKSAIRGIAILGQVLANIAIWLIVLSPVWATALGITYWRLRKRKVKA